MKILSRTVSLSLMGAVGMFAQSVPQAYQAIYNNMTTQIGAFQTTINQGWNKSAYPVSWAPHLSSAESDQFTALLAPGYYQQTVLVELQEIQATGATAVTVHINFPILYQPFYTYSNNPSQYQQFVSFYQQMASDIHARGLKLVIESTVSESLDGTQGASFEPYYQSLDWNDFMADRAQNAVNTAQLLNPDYLSLICEPDTEAANAYQPTENSPTGSMQLLQTMLTAFQEANITNVTLGAGTGTWIASFSTYIQDFSTTSLSYIDLHVYPVTGSDLTNVLTASTMIQQAGKQIGVSEAWPNKMSNSGVGNLTISTVDARDVFSFWSPVDTSFLQAMVDCAQYEHFAFFSPSYPAYFASYLNFNTYGSEPASTLLPTASTAATNANRVGGFTPTGTAFTQMLVGTDTIPPATPAAPTTTTISSTGATLTWALTTDNVGVAAYNVYRNGVQVSQLAMPPFYDTGLTPGLTYVYTLTAFDALGNVSAQSPPLNVLTIDTSGPSVPANLTATTVTPISVSLSWSASTSPGGVSGYRVLKGSSPSSMTIVGNATGTTYVDTHVSPQLGYFYAVEAFNPIGIASAPSSTLPVTTLAVAPPSGLKGTAVSTTSVTLTWQAATGGDGPFGYRVLRGTSPTSLSTIVSKNSTTTYTNSVAPGTTYYYEVETVDTTGYTSVPTAVITVTSPK